METATTLQIRLKFENIISGKLIDLSGLDLRGVNMQHPEIKDGFKKVAENFASSKEDPPNVIDMYGSDISSVDLRGFDFSNVNLNGVNARGTVFINCIFSDSALEDADLENADFRQADLYHTKFYGANIKGVNFAGAKMTNTHGLGLKQPDYVIKRLSVVSSIFEAELPEDMEKFRGEIENIIYKGRDKTPKHKPDLIEYDDEEDKDEKNSGGKSPVIGKGFFD